MATQEQYPEANNNAATEEQLRHSGKDGYEKPIREFRETPLDQAPLDYDPRLTREELRTSDLPEGFHPTPTSPEKTKKNRRLLKVAGGVLVLVTAAGAAIGLSGGDKEAPEKAPGQTLVLGTDGEPLRVVPYDPEVNNDRDGNGIDDAFNDSDKDGAMDALQDWDQEAQMYVDKNAEYNQQVIDGASQEDLSSIAEIESAYPGIDGVKPSWKADFILLDPLVKRFVLEELSRSGDFATTDDWKSAVLYAFTLTPEEIEAAANNYE